MEGRYTPAPWFIDRFYKTAINNAPGDEKHKHIAMINFYNAIDPAERIDEEEHEANVRLIAAAPELLENLITTNTALILAYQGKNIPSNIRDIIEENRILIAKAKGE